MKADLSLEYRDLDSLVPYAANARTHSQAQVAEIARSITEFGWTNPVLIDPDDGIIAGHGRVLAARKLGMAQVPVIVLAGLTPAQRRAYVIADNRLALNAGWDLKTLAAEVDALLSGGFDVDILGFTKAELGSLGNIIQGTPSGLTDPDALPTAPEHVTTRTGDVWVLGHHRIVCGDSTDREVVARVLNGAQPRLMVTDPPYGVKYDPRWRAQAGINRNPDKMGRVLNDDRADWREAWALFPGAVAYVWCASIFNDVSTTDKEVQ